MVLQVNKTYNNIWLNFSKKILETKRSKLRLFKYSVLDKQSDEPLWAQNEKMTPVKKWSCEEVKKMDHSN